MIEADEDVLDAEAEAEVDEEAEAETQDAAAMPKRPSMQDEPLAKRHVMMTKRRVTMANATAAAQAAPAWTRPRPWRRSRAPRERAQLSRTTPRPNTPSRTKITSERFAGRKMVSAQQPQRQGGAPGAEGDGRRRRRRGRRGGRRNRQGRNGEAPFQGNDNGGEPREAAFRHRSSRR